MIDQDERTTESPTSGGTTGVGDGVLGTTLPSTGSEPRGGISSAIFAEVEQMTTNGAMSKSDAFARIAERTGRNAGTVSANYYNVARKRGGTLQSRVRKSPVGTAASRASTIGGAVTIIGRLESTMKELTNLLLVQETEIARLREQADKFEKFRAWMAKNG
ncbi:MAG: hypothetical protein EXQ74_06855 [Thermoleophilia bacterium]|nr:hypothetical protein [Thermoleophilia bacterium]